MTFIHQTQIHGNATKQFYECILNHNAWRHSAQKEIMSSIDGSIYDLLGILAVLALVAANGSLSRRNFHLWQVAAAA
jgi:hypothetical protein